MLNKLKRFNVMLPSKVLEAIDSLIKEGMFTDRGDFLKEASRKHLADIGYRFFNIEAEEPLEQEPSEQD